MGRDKYGHYVNDEGVEIRSSSDKYGRDHIDIYDSCPADNKDHGSIHINWDSDTEEEVLLIPPMEIKKQQMLVVS